MRSRAVAACGGGGGGRGSQGVLGFGLQGCRALAVKGPKARGLILNYRGYLPSTKGAAPT